MSDPTYLSGFVRRSEHNRQAIHNPPGADHA